MFGSDFQTSADMPLHQLLEVFIIPHRLVFFGSAVVQEQIVADAGAHRGFLDLGMLVNLLVDLDQRVVVGVEVLADGGL